MSKKILQDLIQKLEQQKFNEGQGKDLMSAIQAEQTKALQPVMEKMGADMAEAMVKKFDDAVRGIKIDSPQVNIPEMKMPEIVMPDYPAITVPEPKVTVNFDTSKIRVVVPDIKVPDVVMPKRISVSLDEVDNKNPLPVMMMGNDGKPMGFPSFGGSSGKADHLTIKGFNASAFTEIQDGDGRLKVALATGSSGLTDAELRASHLDVVQMSGTIDSVYITGASGSIAASIVDSSGVGYSGSNPVPVSLISGSLSSTGAYLLDGDGAYRGTLPISGSVAVSGVTGSIGATILDGDGAMKTTWIISDVTNSIQSALVDSTGVQYSGSNPVPVSGTVVVSSITASTGTNIVDSSGVAYSGSNPLPISGNVNVNGSLNSILATGVTLHDAVDDGDAPLKVGGVAKTTNPTAVSDGDRVRFTADDLGRQLVRPVQVRDLIATAYVALANGTETTLLAAVAGAYQDLIYVLASNSSTAAVGLDIRAVTGGNILMHLEIPANATTGLSLPIPMFGASTDATGNNWTIDMPDITGTTVYVSALFSKEI